MEENEKRNRCTRYDTPCTTSTKTETYTAPHIAPHTPHPHTNTHSHTSAKSLIVVSAFFLVSIPCISSFRVCAAACTSSCPFLSANMDTGNTIRRSAFMTQTHTPPHTHAKKSAKCQVEHARLIHSSCFALISSVVSPAYEYRFTNAFTSSATAGSR